MSIKNSASILDIMKVLRWQKQENCFFTAYSPNPKMMCKIQPCVITFPVCKHYGIICLYFKKYKYLYVKSPLTEGRQSYLH